MLAQPCVKNLKFVAPPFACLDDFRPACPQLAHRLAIFPPLLGRPRRPLLTPLLPRTGYVWRFFVGFLSSSVHPRQSSYASVWLSHV